MPSATELCRGNYTTSFLPDVTMSDLASFRPAAPTLVSEPDGFGVARMPTNLVASGAAPHTAAGSLFGYAVTVRFSPIAFRFDYGDGTSRSTATPGASWSALGAPQFTATDTSHAYPAPGAYTATVTTTYTAQVSFGTAWRDVPGTLELTSPAASLRVLEARTALVRDTCDVNPTAAGC
ncbi:hypothetical protein [Microbacterium sp. SORGH_AS_0888]|uniref:hypothetical protein n=1 Tax=Microbacterium sp. SORGH_AS_0888 TaxID=3041791 RepID=UPI0027D8D883|nr:hypothetical protein [Microbacterium sp. SORGH_AS_0888]